MPYEFLEDVATADIAFLAWGPDLETIFRAAADATVNVMVDALEAVELRQKRRLVLRNEALDLLLFEFLQELIYYKDSEKLILRVNELHIETADGAHGLEATACGETLDPDKHHPRVDVKAVTLHRFRLEKTDRGWEAFVILDI